MCINILETYRCIVMNDIQNTRCIKTSEYLSLSLSLSIYIYIYIYLSM